jgi:hypothetical protein
MSRLDAQLATKTLILAQTHQVFIMVLRLKVVNALLHINATGATLPLLTAKGHPKLITHFQQIAVIRDFAYLAFEFDTRHNSTAFKK